MGKVFGLRLWIVILLPVIALIYFSYHYISERFDALHKSSAYILSAKIMSSATKLVHNIQLERGYSAGYIITVGSKKYQTKLLSQYKDTDVAYHDFLYFVHLDSGERKAIQKLLLGRNKPKVKRVLSAMHEIEGKRAAVQHGTIDISGIIQYYSGIDSELLDMIYTLSTLPKGEYDTPPVIYQIQQIKENVGLEKAYLFKTLLAENVSSAEKERIRVLIDRQNALIKRLKENMLLDTTLLYNKTIHAETKQRIAEYRKDFFAGKLGKEDAWEWCKITTQRINELEKLSTEILTANIAKLEKIHCEARRSLYITLLLWILSILSFVVILYLLNRLLKNEARLIEDLRVSAYAFEAHEGMMVVDERGNILRVNKAFTHITGYSSEEVVGKSSTRIFRTDKHSHFFYGKILKHVHEDGYWSGEVYNRRKNGEIYPVRLSITAIRNGGGEATHYIVQFLDITDLKKAEEEAVRQSKQDSLTELPNRKSMLQKLHEELSRAKRHGYYSAFLFLDIDDFKKVNDQYGHAVGDKLLLEVAKRLRHTVREEDYVARLGGDEFCMMLLNLDKRKWRAAIGVNRVCQNIIENIASSYFIDGKKIHIGISIGVKIFPDGSRSVDEIINHADLAMYEAKQNGKNRFVYYEKGLDSKIKELGRLEQEVKEGIEQKEFKFYMQPRIDVSTERICGAELLLRWEHPVRGLLHPESFLHVIKSSGMIGKITSQALHTACRFLQYNTNRFDGVLSINIASNELYSEQFVEMVENTIESYGVAPDRIELEITEDELIPDFHRIISNIERLKQFGVKLAIDDFGQGYSSITYLQRLSVDTLKVDRRFIQQGLNKNTKALLKLMVDIARIFELTIVIEGVETAEHLELIRSYGADAYQGYFHCQALSEEGFKEYLEH